MTCKCLDRAAKVCDRANLSVAASTIRALPCDCVCVPRELLAEFRTFINMTGDGANAGHIALAKRIDALLASKEPT